MTSPSLKNYPFRRQFSSQISLPMFEDLKLMKLLTFLKMSFLADEKYRFITHEPSGLFDSWTCRLSPPKTPWGDRSPVVILPLAFPVTGLRVNPQCGSLAMGLAAYRIIYLAYELWFLSLSKLQHLSSHTNVDMEVHGMMLIPQPPWVPQNEIWQKDRKDREALL